LAERAGAVWDWGREAAERGEEEGTGSGGWVVRMGDRGGSVERRISGAGGPRTAATEKTWMDDGHE
jgi:hypothetical protein